MVRELSPYFLHSLRHTRNRFLPENDKVGQLKCSDKWKELRKNRKEETALRITAETEKRTWDREVKAAATGKESVLSL